MNIQWHRKRSPLPAEPVESASTPRKKNCQYNGWDITVLPIELVVKILANLDACDLLVCKRVSKYWNNLIVTMPTLACAFYRSCRPSVPTLPSLTALPRSASTLAPWQSYYLLIRDWLEGFSKRGRQAVLQLDEMLEDVDQRLPEQLFFNIAHLLETAEDFGGKQLGTIAHTNWIKTVRFSPNEQHLATVSYDYTVQLCSLVNGQWYQIATLPQPARAWDAGFSANSQYVATVSEFGNADIWEFVAETWELVGERSQRKHVCFPGTYPPLSCGVKEQHQVRWVRNAHLPGAYPLPCFSAKANYLVATFANHTAKIYAPVNGQWQPQDTALDTCRVARAQFHPIDNHLLATGYDNVVSIWRFTGEQWQQSANLEHSFYHDSLRFSPDGCRLLTRSLERTEAGCQLAHLIQSACIWHLVDGVWQKEAVLLLPSGMKTAHFSSYGHSILSMLWGGPIDIWQLSAGKWKNIPLRARSHRGYLSANGSHLATRPARITNNTARVWRFIGDQWREEALIQHSGRVNDIRFSVYGNHVITASDDKTAKIYGYIGGTWREKTTLFHADRVLSARFSPFGRYVLTTTADHAAHLWILTNKKESAD